MTTEASNERDDQLLAMMGLATIDADSDEECPAEALLAAFIDGGLTGEERQSVLAHLNRCSACYQNCLVVDEALKAAEPVAEEPRRQETTSVIMQGLKRLLTPWSLAISMAAAAVVALVVFMPAGSGLHDGIDALYLAQRPNAESLAEPLQQMALPWAASTFAFSQTGASAARRAFAAGIEEGRSSLLALARTAQAGDGTPEALNPLEDAVWSETAWNDYFQLGRWVLLLWAQSASATGLPDGSAHTAAVLAFKDALIERRPADPSVDEALTELLRIEDLLAKAMRQPGRRHMTDLGRRLMLTMHRLSP